MTTIQVLRESIQISHKEGYECHRRDAEEKYGQQTLPSVSGDERCEGGMAHNDDIKEKTKCVMKSMKCLTHNCDVKRVISNSRVWGWVEKKKSYAFKSKKTSRLICTYEKSLNVPIQPPNTTTLAGEFEPRLGGDNLESSRSNSSNEYSLVEKKIGPD